MKCTAWVTMLRNHTWFTGGLRSNMDFMNLSFIFFETIIVIFSVREINDNLRASRAQSQTQFELCRGTAVNADVSPNLLTLDRSLMEVITRHAA